MRFGASRGLASLSGLPVFAIGFDATTDAAGGGGTTPDAGVTNTDTSASNPGNPGQDPTGGQKPETTPDPTDKSKWTPEQWQQEINRIAANARNEGKAAAERDADNKKRQEQGQFQSLYEELKKKEESDYLPLQQRVSAYEAHINKMIDGVVADWPEEVRKSDPKSITPDNVDVVSRMNWVETHKDMAGLVKQAKTAPKIEGGPLGITGKDGEKDPVNARNNLYKANPVVAGLMNAAKGQQD